MQWHVTPYIVALLGSAVVLSALALLLWRRRMVRGGKFLFFLLVAVVEWTLATAFEAIATGISTKIFWSKMQYIGITTSPGMFLAFTLDYSRLKNWLTRRNLALSFVIPLVTLGLAATNEWHHLIWTSFTFSEQGPNTLIYGHGVAFWMWIAYVYMTLSAGILLLIRAVVQQRHLYRRQAVLNLVGGFFPCLGNVLYLVGWDPALGQDLTPIAFALTGAFLSVNMLQFRFLDLVPVARDALVEQMKEGVLVLDAQDRIVDMNPAVRDLIEAETLQVGDDIAIAMASWPELVGAWRTIAETPTEVQLNSDPPRYVSICVSRLDDRQHKVTGRLIMIQDITARKQAEEERERLILELQEALANVKTLRGLLPICANCKKVRDDAGYWRSVEEYVMEHSEAYFSHGICPDCMKDLYPWFEPEEK